MFIQPTIDKLHALKLTGMADAVCKQLEDPGASQLSLAISAQPLEKV